MFPSLLGRPTDRKLWVIQNCTTRASSSIYHVPLQSSVSLQLNVLSQSNAALPPNLPHPLNLPLYVNFQLYFRTKGSQICASLYRLKSSLDRLFLWLTGNLKFSTIMRRIFSSTFGHTLIDAHLTSALNSMCLISLISGGETTDVRNTCRHLILSSLFT